jgi:hypothetical protein
MNRQAIITLSAAIVSASVACSAAFADSESGGVESSSFTSMSGGIGAAGGGNQSGGVIDTGGSSQSGGTPQTQTVSETGAVLQVGGNAASAATAVSGGKELLPERTLSESASKKSHSPILAVKNYHWTAGKTVHSNSKVASGPNNL